MKNTQESDDQMEGSSNEPQRSGNGQKGLIAMAAVVAILAIVTGVTFVKRHTAPKGFDVSAMRVERVTRNGNATTVAISPDGRTIAYVLRNGAIETLMLRLDGGASDTELIAPDKIGYLGLTFSPDGNSLYYTASTRDNRLYSSLFKMPVHGGAAQKLIDDIDTAVSFSPDGTQFAFERGVPDKREVDLLIANADGSNVKVIAKKPGQAYAATLIGPAWSPDGGTILFPIFQSASQRFLMAVAPDGTGLRKFYNTNNDVGRPQWLPDGSAVIVPMQEGKLGARGELWKIDFTTAQAQPIASDQRDLNTKWFGLNRNATSLVAVEKIVNGDLWIVPNGNSDDARQLTSGGTLVVYVSNFGKDKILYEMRDGEVFTADANGGNPKQVPMATAGLRDVSACGDGKHIVYSATGDEGPQIWRADANGANAAQLTKEKSATMPNCTSDGQWINFWNDEEMGFYRISINGGSTAKTDLTVPGDPFKEYTRMSPGASSVTSTAENLELQHMQSAESELLSPPQRAPDGSGLYFNLLRQGVANIWKMERPRTKLKPVTNFPSGLIASFAWSQDGKTLYVARGTRSTDVLVYKAAK